MKKYLYLFAFIFSGLIHSQSSGITYQAVIYNPSGEELPGQNNMTAPLTEQDICLRFNFIDSSGSLEYQEVIQVTTDVFGMVNVIIGNDIQTGGYAEGFEGIVWDGSAKNLMVEVDVKGNCSDYDEISNQPFTYIPFAYYSANPGNPGPEGPAGPQGEQGDVGQTGPAGADGVAGPQGEQGPAGAQGEQGAQGIPGIGGEGSVGADGQDGLTAYEVWINLGNTGTEQEFIDSLVGPQGETGEGLNSLIKTSDEEAGDNCENGGIKIETGLDTNDNGELDEDEVDDSLTKYLCNGADGNDDGGSSGINAPFLSLECVEMGVSPLCPSLGLSPIATLNSPDNYNYYLSANMGVDSENNYPQPHWRKFKISGLSQTPGDKIMLKFRQLPGTNAGQNDFLRVFLEPEIINGESYFYVYASNLANNIPPNDCATIEHYGIPPESSHLIESVGGNFQANYYYITSDYEIFYEKNNTFLNTGIVFGIL